MQSQRAVTTARTDYERVHDRLMLEVPQLLEGRVEYFDVCLAAVMKAQVTPWPHYSQELIFICHYYFYRVCTTMNAVLAFELAWKVVQVKMCMQLYPKKEFGKLQMQI